MLPDWLERPLRLTLDSCFRYLRLFVNLYGFLNLRVILPVDPERRKLNAKDVTVIVPTLGEDSVEATLTSILVTAPFKIYLVTVDANYAKVHNVIKRMKTDSLVELLSISYPNKRHQMARAIPLVRTKVTVFTDDDIIWPPTILLYMLAPLEYKKYGGVGTNQRLKRSMNPSFEQALWEFLGALYLQRRNFDWAACTHMDGGRPCLSGRTVAYKTDIINDPSFTYNFTNESWGFLTKYSLNTDDDNFITRWLDSHGHSIAFQYHPDAEVLTRLEND